MSIITKRGDHGQTDLLYGRRVPKQHPRIRANGSLDELSASLGLVRWHARADGYPTLDRRMASLQRQLITIMGQLATLNEDRDRFLKDGFQEIQEKDVEALGKEATQLESDLNQRFKDWALPGNSGPAAAAYLDQARTLCRRAESQAWEVAEQTSQTLEHALTFLNRLADYLWLLARAVDQDPLMILETPNL